MSSPSITVGAFTVSAHSDGWVHLPPSYYPGLDFDAHGELLGADGTYRFPAGFFLIRGNGETILVDAGIGPLQIPFPPEIAAAAGLTDPPAHIAAGGALPEQLAAVGVDPADVTAVLLTHLDADHVGWVAPRGELFFPNAQVLAPQVELELPPGPAPGEAEGREGLAIADRASRLTKVSADVHPVVPGVAARFAPGHTPGHYVVRIESEGQQAVLLGDAIHHPLQLDDPGIAFGLEARPKEALAMRERLVADLENTGIPVNMCHFPGLEFQTIVADADGRRWAPYQA
jgi:glyoxylase-like metal-dependent hydrolase (beta-lactamase superfamily II)